MRRLAAAAVLMLAACAQHEPTPAAEASQIAVITTQISCSEAAGPRMRDVHIHSLGVSSGGTKGQMLAVHVEEDPATNYYLLDSAPTGQFSGMVTLLTSAMASKAPVRIAWTDHQTATETVKVISWATLCAGDIPGAPPEAGS